jgi:hypothetical protein
MGIVFDPQDCPESWLADEVAGRNVDKTGKSK